MGCDKVGFATQAEALAALARARRRPAPHTWKVPTRAYVCSVCSDWHLTSAPRKTSA